MKNPLNDFGAAFLARDLHRLRREITEQTDHVIRAAGIDIPSSCTSLVLSLVSDNRSAAELSETLSYSHQLTTQRINMLLKLGLAARLPALDDRRKKNIALTEEGRRQTQTLMTVLPQINIAFLSLFSEIGVPLSAACQEALRSLEENPVLKRINATAQEEISS